MSPERLPRDRRGRRPQRARRRPPTSRRPAPGPSCSRRRHKVGGAADTMAPWPEAPEFKVTTLSYVMSLMPDTILRDLAARAARLRGRPRSGRTSCRSPTGAASCSTTTTPRKNYESFAQFSKRDADAIEQLGRVDRRPRRRARAAADVDAADARVAEAGRSDGAAPARVAVPRPRRAGRSATSRG